MAKKCTLGKWSRDEMYLSSKFFAEWKHLYDQTANTIFLGPEHRLRKAYRAEIKKNNIICRARTNEFKSLNKHKHELK